MVERKGVMEGGKKENEGLEDIQGTDEEGEGGSGMRENSK